MRLLWTRQEESVATASGLLEDFHGEVAPACLVLSGGGPGVSTVWFPAAAAVVRGGVGCGRECGGRRGSRARHWPVAGEIRRRAGRGDCHRGCWLGGLEKAAVTDETAAEGGPREALSHFLRNSCSNIVT